MSWSLLLNLGQLSITAEKSAASCGGQMPLESLLTSAS